MRRWFGTVALAVLSGVLILGSFVVQYVLGVGPFGRWMSLFMAFDPRNPESGRAMLAASQSGVAIESFVVLPVLLLLLAVVARTPLSRRSLPHLAVVSLPSALVVGRPWLSFAGFVVAYTAWLWVLLVLNGRLRRKLREL